MTESASSRIKPRRRVTVVRRVLNLLFPLIVRRQVSGIENIPATGPFVLVFNHLSNFDPHLIFSLVTRSDAIGLVADSYRRNPFYRFAVETAGGTWIQRGAGDRRALQNALDHLERGWMVGIAPEGRRSPTGTLSRGKRGPAFLATHANVPVLPVAVTKTENVARALKRLRRITVTVRVGEPFHLPPLVPGNHKQQLEAATDTLMRRIAALLPPEYRGVYADPSEPEALLSAEARS